MKLNRIEIFDYEKSTYNEFALKLEKVIKELISQAKNGIVAKSLIIYSMGLNNYSHWKRILAKETVLDGKKKLWLMNYVMSLQEQHFLDFLGDITINGGLKQYYINMFPLFYGQIYRDELSTEDTKKLELIKEKFTIELKGDNSLND